ncbi:MAG: DUF5106 domain-containing protein [Bacteroidales bacterium]|nr:DUF5106 domain-containing protein [Bacteroidales bacterium]
MEKKTTILLAALLLLGSANCFSQEKVSRKFELPSIPDTLRTIESRFNYVVDHYWNRFDFSDTFRIETKETEEALVNYLDLISRLSAGKGQEHLSDLMGKASANSLMQEYINKLTRKYLVNYDSPMRNELLYVGAARYLAENATDPTLKYNAIQDTTMLSLNLPGTKATEFQFTTPTGEIKKIGDVQGKYTVLLFYNPDCKSCSQILEATKRSEIIHKALEEENTTLVAIYPQDDSYIWRKYIETVPDKWINGCDNGMTLISEVLYDLRVLPVFYLLDSNKEVVLKDVPLKTIEEFFK